MSEVMALVMSRIRMHRPAGWEAGRRAAPCRTRSRTGKLRSHRGFAGRATRYTVQHSTDPELTSAEPIRCWSQPATESGPVPLAPDGHGGVLDSPAGRPTTE